MNSSLFPFTAIIGMDLARHSLIYHAIDRTLGGTVLMGHRGCAKSTLVRAFQEILSQDDGSEAPFVEVPLGASEERLLGSVDAASLVEQGQWKEHSGLLEQAHGGVLYVDEVNLLPDHLVDQTLDAAASGRYRLEREGLSREVEARFILVGTMNPEEGDLRPQLLDRFTHGVLIRDEYTAEERREIVRARMEFEDDPQDFRTLHRTELEQLRERIQEARTRLKSIRILEEQRVSVSERAASMGLEGIRAELGVLRTARCAAAWRGDDSVNEGDLEEAWKLCLAHRHPQEDTPVPPRNTERSSAPKTENRENQSPSPVTASVPRDARRDSIHLEVSHRAFHPDLHEWWNQSAVFKKGINWFPLSRRVSPRSSSSGSIDWTATLAASRKKGWVPGSPLSLRYQNPERRPLLWLFLDASRSAGALKFLGTALMALQNLGLRQASRRFQVLLLKDDRLEWKLKRGTAGAALKTMDELRSASGKSRLHLALEKMDQAVRKAGVLPEDRLLICSDGLFTPDSAGSLESEKRRFQGLLKKMVQRFHSSAWLHPVPKRGMRRWIPDLADSSKIQLIEIG